VITDDDIARRLDEFRATLVARGIDAAVVTRPQNVFYLSNYRASGIAAQTSRLHALVVPASGDATLMVRSLESGTAAAMTPAPWVAYDDAVDPFDVLADILGAVAGNGSPVVGVELQRITAFQHQEISSRLPGVSFLDVSGAVENLALRLRPSEVEHMVAAARVSTAGLRAGLDLLRPGVSAAAVVGAVQQAMYDAEQSDFEKSFVALWSGPRGGHMHDTRLARTLATGDVATVEVMGVDNHYYACAQYTAVVGEVEVAGFEEHQRLVVAMHDAARAVVRDGVEAREVYEAASAVYRDATGAPYFRRVGGSMGLTTFGLDLAPGNTAVLRSGMPMLIQTLVTDPMLIACGTTVLVTADGYTPLTARPAEDEAPR
jgi:Xaa-Pro dipeptidase